MSTRPIFDRPPSLREERGRARHYIRSQISVVGPRPGCMCLILVHLHLSLSTSIKSPLLDHITLYLCYDYLT